MDSSNSQSHLYSDVSRAITTCHFPASHHIDELCHSSSSAADEVNYISGRHVGLSKAAGVRAVCPPSLAIPCIRRDQKRWIQFKPEWTVLHFQKVKAKRFHQMAFDIKVWRGSERECREGTLPCINITSKTAKLKISYGHSTVPNPFQQATILVSSIQKDLRLRAKAD